MPRIQEGSKGEVEARIQQAIQHYQNSKKPSLRSSAEKYGIAYSTLRGRLQGRQARETGHLHRQVLSEYEEKSIVNWCGKLDEWGHPARLAVVKGMAEAVIARREKERILGKNWMSRFLRRHPELATKLGTRLDRQRARASDPVVLKDYFKKVFKIVLS